MQFIIGQYLVISQPQYLTIKIQTCAFQAFVIYIIINKQKNYQLFQNLMNTVQKTPFQDRRLSQRPQKIKYQQKSIREHAYSRNSFDSNLQQMKGNYDIRQSKQTLSTNNSFRDDIYGSAVVETVQPFHDFTFYARDIQKIQLQQNIPLKTTYKFSNQSFQCVIFYALIYNHLHLQEIKQNLLEITFISFNSYELIKKNLLKYDQIMIKNRLQNYIFPHSAFRLIQNQSLSLKDRKIWLKDLINKIDPSVAQKLVEQMCKDAKINFKLDNPLISEDQSLIKIDKIASYLGIKIKLYCDSKKISLGKKNSCITISIKLTEDNCFHLKRLTCYEEYN